MDPGWVGARRVGISGSYGGLNLGDEAILEAMLGQLRGGMPDLEITVFSRDPVDTLERHRVDKAVPVRQLLVDEVRPELEGLDLFVLGGGGILFDGDVATYLREVNLAHSLGVPVMVYAVSAGPLKDRENQHLLRRALSRCALVTVREPLARSTLEGLGVDGPIHVTADPALLLEPASFPRERLQGEGVDVSRRLVGMSVREPGPAAPDIDQEAMHALLANAADYIVDRYHADVVFVPMEARVKDVQQAHGVVSRMLRPRRATVLKGDYSSGEVLGLMGQMDFAVGMRLHFLIFAALQGVPFVALPYSPKVRGFVEDLGLVTPPLELVNAGRLMAHMDHSWDRREQIRSIIGDRLPALKERARRTGEMALDLLRAGPHQGTVGGERRR